MLGTIPLLSQGGGISINNFLKNPVSLKGKNIDEIIALQDVITNKAVFVALKGFYPYVGYVNVGFVATSNSDNKGASGNYIYNLIPTLLINKSYVTVQIYGFNKMSNSSDSWKFFNMYKATHILDIDVWYGDLPF